MTAFQLDFMVLCKAVKARLKLPVLQQRILTNGYRGNLIAVKIVLLLREASMHYMICSFHRFGSWGCSML